MYIKLVAFLGTAIAASSFTLPASAGIQDFRVYNRTSSPIVSLKVSSSYQDTWGNNVLRQTLRSGYQTEIKFLNGIRNCHFDIKAEFSDGYQLSYYSVNLCAVSDVYFP
jgi:hypothetical protein